MISTRKIKKIILSISFLLLLTFSILGLVSKKSLPLVYATLPSSYDLRDDDLVTSVKSQGPYGSCWAFSTVAAIESNMLSDGDGVYSNYDLSELQLLYSTYNMTNDAKGNIGGDGAYVNPSYSDYGFMSVGGNAGTAGYSLMTWMGLASESELPYSTAESVMASGIDRSIPYKKDLFHLQNMLFIPFSSPTRIKQAVLDYGALSISISDRSRNPIVYNSSTASYYCSDVNVGIPNGSGGEYPASGHAITLVGWNDNYSLTNFVEGHRPSQNGAWLIKDSVGTDWGQDGYWWCSYEDVDMSVTSGKMATVYDAEKADNYENIYQYDGGSANSYATLQSSSDIGLANVFTAEKTEVIKAVAFSMSQYENKSYKIDIYKNAATGTVEPDVGTLLHSQTGTVVDKGYHTVKLTSPVVVNAGDRFSVIVSYSATYDSFYNEYEVCFDFDRAASESYSPIWYRSSISAGQSFINRTYYDNYRNNLAGPYWQDLSSAAPLSPGNLRIKAYTDDYVDLSKLEIVSDLTKLNYVEGEALNLSGLVVRYTNSLGSSSIITDYTLSIADGTTLSTAHNGTKITVTYNGLEAFTSALVVTSQLQAATPVVTSQPINASFTIGYLLSDAVLTTAATTQDNGTLSFQWFKSLDASTSDGEEIVGKTQTTLTIPTSISGTTYYYCKITNTLNGNQSYVLTNSARVIIQPLPNPIVTSQPESITLKKNTSKTLSFVVKAQNDMTVSYQWYKNSSSSIIGATRIVGATTSEFTPSASEIETTYYFAKAVLTRAASTEYDERTITLTSQISKFEVIKKDMHSLYTSLIIIGSFLLVISICVLFITLKRRKLKYKI